MFTYETYPSTSVHSIKNQWDELNKDEFIFLTGLILDFYSNSILFEDLKLEFLKYLIQYKPSKQKDFTEEEKMNVQGSLLQLADQVNFFMDEIITDEQITYKLKLNFTRNFIDHIKAGRKIMYGPEFRVLPESGIIQTNVTAEEFIDAHGYYNLFDKSKDESNLDFLVSTLYRPMKNRVREEYITLNSQKRAHLFKNVPLAQKYGVFFFFQALMDYFFDRTEYGLLFKRQTSSDETKITLGLGEMLYDLTQKGFGSKNEVSNLVVTEFFDIRLKLLFDSIQAMHDAEIPIEKIEDKTGISEAKLKKIIR